VALTLAVLAMGLGGCKEQALKEEIATLNARLAAAQSENSNLASQNATLANENMTLKGQLADAQRKSVAPPPVDNTKKGGNPFDKDLDVSETARDITVTLPDDVLFDSGKAELKGTSKATLDKIAGVIKRDYTGKEIQVVGHTDADPIRKSGWKDNWELSAQRALAVVRYLASQGVPEKQVTAAGRGQYLPRDSNATAAGKSRNRRVQIVIIK
jgi:chemotaxis protein MotB